MLAAVLAILDLLRRVARPHDSVLGFVPEMAGMHDLDDYPDALPVPGLVVYRYDAPLFFANAEANVEIDLTAADTLDQLRRDLADRGIVFALARVKQELREQLESAALLDKVGEDRIFTTLPTAVEAFRNRATDQKAPGSQP